MKKISYILVTFMCFVLLVSCGQNISTEELWQTATYTEDTEIGSGEKTLTVKVIAEEKSVVLTLHTDKDILGDALTEYELISGEQGAYGLYVKIVNGIYADYNTTKSYWSVNKDGEYMMSGVDTTEFADGDTYELKYTKG